MPTKRAVYPVEFKALNDATGQVEALVSIFGNVDLQGDRIVKGAFAKSIADWKASGDPVPVVFSHEWDDIWSHIGVVDTLQETAKGLRAVYTLDIATNPAAAQVYLLMKRRSLKEHSFAYDVVQEHRAKDGANELTELTIIEVGPTLKGANPDTELIAVKSLLEVEAAKHAAKAVVPPTDEDEDPVELAQAADAVLDSVGIALDAGDIPTAQALLVAAEASLDDLIALLGGTDADDTKSAKAGARLSAATKTELASIHDGMGDLQSRMKTLMGVAEETNAASSDGPEGAKTAATDLNENATEHGTAATESPTAKSTDASVTDLRTRILAMRATTGVTP